MWLKKLQNLTPAQAYDSYKNWRVTRWSKTTLEASSFAPLDQVKSQESQAPLSTNKPAFLKIEALNPELPVDSTLLLGKFEFRIDIDVEKPVGAASLDFSINELHRFIQRAFPISDKYDDWVPEGVEFHLDDLAIEPSSSTSHIFLKITINAKYRNKFPHPDKSLDDDLYLLLTISLQRSSKKLAVFVTNHIETCCDINGWGIRIDFKRLFWAGKFSLDESFVQLIAKKAIDQIINRINVNGNIDLLERLLYWDSNEPLGIPNDNYANKYLPSNSIRLLILKELFSNIRNHEIQAILKPLKFTAKRFTDIHGFGGTVGWQTSKPLKNNAAVKQLALDVYLSTPELWGVVEVDDVIHSILKLNEISSEIMDTFIDTLCSQADVTKLLPLFRSILTETWPIEHKYREKIVRRLASQYQAVGNTLTKEIEEIVCDLISQVDAPRFNYEFRESWASLAALFFRLAPEKSRHLFEHSLSSQKRLELLTRFGIFAIDGNQKFTEEDIERVMQTLALLPVSHIWGVRVISKNDINHLARLEKNFSIENQNEALNIEEWLLTRESSYEKNTKAIRLHSLHIEKRPVLIHEVGHAVWFYNLSEQQRNDFGTLGNWLPLPDPNIISDPLNFARTYGMNNLREDWATLYEAWATDFRKLKSKRKKSLILDKKVSWLAGNAFFKTSPDGKIVIMVYPGGIPLEKLSTRSKSADIPTPKPKD